MKIQKVKSLRNFGIFHDFEWNRSIPEFKRFNLIYGWNRSGKTFLSRIFLSCQEKTIDFDQYPENGEFQIEGENKLNINQMNVSNQQILVKVFNSDFIKKNLFFDNRDKHCNPIIYISDIDIKIKNKLDHLKEQQKEFSTKSINAVKIRSDKQKAEENFRTTAALNIKTALANPKVRDKYRDYDRRNVQDFLEKTDVDNLKKLTVEEYHANEEIISREAKKKLDTLPQYFVTFHFREKHISDFEDLFQTIELILSKKVISETIRRLKNDQELNNWVKQGYDLHLKKNELERCLFCGKELKKELLESLSKHFSKDYAELQVDIEELLKKLKGLKKEKLAEENDLYSDLISVYEVHMKNLNNLTDELETWLNNSIEKLQLKQNNPFSTLRIEKKPIDYQSKYNETIDYLNEIIKKHNNKVDNHEQEVNKAKVKLEHHFIAEYAEKLDYRNIKKEYDRSVENEKEIKMKLEQIEEDIKDLELETSNIGKAVQKINKYLEELFGRKEIQLELDDKKMGYLIKRDGQVAKNLSESEKTAIAFSYFITKVKERDFKVKDGIIFIDDPVSSLDSNFLYHCFSMIRNHFKYAGQLFITTHNFELLNLVKDWFCGKNIKAKEKRKDEICEFYMIENRIENDRRVAGIIPLEETLKKFKSEYHYLFFLLNRFVENDETEYSDYYTIGNIARRFLEIFTNFKIPTTGDLASKIEALHIDKEIVSGIEQDKVYKLIQEFSHGFDPTSTIEHKDKRESKEAIKVLLKIIRESDPRHFELLERICRQAS